MNIQEEIKQTFKAVPDRQRNGFNVRQFNDPLFDCRMFRIADRMIKNYKGGSWSCTTIPSNPENPGFFEIPTEKKVTLRNIFSHDEVEADSRLAGMIVTSFTLLSIAERTNSDFHITKLEALREEILNYCSLTKQMDVWMTIMD